MIHVAGRPNPAWRMRPPPRPWDACEDELLAQMVSDGLGFEYMQAMLPDRLNAEILQRRKELVDEGRVKLREPL